MQNEIKRFTARVTVKNATCQITPLAYTKRRNKTLVGLVGNFTLMAIAHVMTPCMGGKEYEFTVAQCTYQPFPERNATSSIMTVRFYFQQKKRIILVQDYSVEFPEYSRLKEEHMAWKSPIFFCFSDVSLEITQSEEEDEEEKGGERSFFQQRLFRQQEQFPTKKRTKKGA